MALSSEMEPADFVASLARGLAVILSVLGTTQAFLVSAARISFSMGSDRVLPPVFGRLNKRFRTPTFATIAFGLFMIGATCVYVLSSSISGAFDVVVSITGVLFALFYAMTGLATAIFYRRLARRSLTDLLATVVREGEGRVEPAGIGRIAPAGPIPARPQPVDIAVMKPEYRIVRRPGDRAHAAPVADRHMHVAVQVTVEKIVEALSDTLWPVVLPRQRGRRTERSGR